MFPLATTTRVLLLKTELYTPGVMGNSVDLAMLMFEGSLFLGKLLTSKILSLSRLHWVTIMQQQLMNTAKF